MIRGLCTIDGNIISGNSTNASGHLEVVPTTTAENPVAQTSARISSAQATVTTASTVASTSTTNTIAGSITAPRVVVRATGPEPCLPTSSIEELFSNLDDKSISAIAGAVMEKVNVRFPGLVNPHSPGAFLFPNDRGANSSLVQRLHQVEETLQNNRETAVVMSRVLQKAQNYLNQNIELERDRIRCLEVNNQNNQQNNKNAGQSQGSSTPDPPNRVPVIQINSTQHGTSPIIQNQNVTHEPANLSEHSVLNSTFRDPSSENLTQADFRREFNHSLGVLTETIEKSTAPN